MVENQLNLLGFQLSPPQFVWLSKPTYNHCLFSEQIRDFFEDTSFFRTALPVFLSLFTKVASFHQSCYQLVQRSAGIWSESIPQYICEHTFTRALTKRLVYQAFYCHGGLQVCTQSTCISVLQAPDTRHQAPHIPDTCLGLMLSETAAWNLL